MKKEIRHSNLKFSAGVKLQSLYKSCSREDGITCIQAEGGWDKGDFQRG